MSDDRVKALDRDGLVRLPPLVEPGALRSMQEAFAARLRWLRWNHFDGYERTELYRHMIQDVLTLDQGFVDLALHPLVIETLRGYLGESFRLTEAKGWKSLATRRSFHAWHGDAWYDQASVGHIPKEVKLAFYLTDAESGEFQYVRGSHRQQHPRDVADHELDGLDPGSIERVRGPAGSAVLFDTSGIHRQGEPILEDRQAVFLNYHDPSVPLQAEDVAYYRYHPLLLNAAFLGDLDEEQRRILGFGDRSHYRHAFERAERFRWLQGALRAGLTLRLHYDDLASRVRARLKRR